jgi:hypothetical protein
MAEAMDASGIPTSMCPLCGSRWLKVAIMFDDETYDVAMWGTRGECYECGTMLTICSPPDKDPETSQVPY